MSGPGSIATTKDGTKRARIRINGRMHSRTYETRTKAAAWLKLMRSRKFLEEVDGVTVETQPKITFRVAAQGIHDRDGRVVQAGFLDHIETIGSLGRRKRRHTPQTLQAYGSQVRQVLSWWGDRRIKATRQEDLDDYETHCRAEGLSTSSIRHRFDRLAQIARFAERKGYVRGLSCRVERPALILASKPRVAGELQLADVLWGALQIAAEIDDVQPVVAVLLASQAGLRREEILRLRHRDVTIEAGQDGSIGRIHVAVEGESFRTKSGKGRTVPIWSAELKSALEPARFGCDGRLMAVKTVSGVTGLLDRAVARSQSLVTKALPKAPADDRKILEQLRAELGAPIGLHDLRHRYATRVGMLTQTPSPRLQAWLGHASLVTTQRYVHADAAPAELLDCPAALAVASSRLVRFVPAVCPRADSIQEDPSPVSSANH